MIQVKSETNYLMDWNNPQDRINYFRNLRGFLSEVDRILEDHQFCAQCIPLASEIESVLNRWNVYFIDVDEIPRVNLDEPK